MTVSRGYAGYVLAVLFLVYVFNFIDRQGEDKIARHVVKVSKLSTYLPANR